VVKLGELMMILELHRQGLTVSAIARQLDMDRKTVRRYIARGLEPPAYGPRPPQQRSTDPFLSSRLIWARFVVHQDLQTILRCHMAALEAIGGAPQEILYDRMKTAVIGEDADGLIVYNRGLLDLARHYGFQPRACRPYRPKTKGKVERPFRYIREDFFLGGSFRNLDDLNAQLRHWLDTVANPRVHATTRGSTTRSGSMSCLTTI